MKIHTEYILITSDKEKEIINITDQVKKIIKKSGINEGIALINPMHITSSIFINDNEEGLKRDFLEWLEKLAPDKPDYHHHMTGEDNADAHLKRTLMGRETTIAISDGKIDFGTWESIFYAEFDGKRTKKILIKILGE